MANIFYRQCVHDSGACFGIVEDGVLNLLGGKTHHVYFYILKKNKKVYKMGVIFQDWG